MTSEVSNKSLVSIYFVAASKCQYPAESCQQLVLINRLRLNVSHCVIHKSNYIFIKYNIANNVIQLKLKFQKLVIGKKIFRKNGLKKIADFFPFQ